MRTSKDVTIRTDPVSILGSIVDFGMGTVPELVDIIMAAAGGTRVAGNRWSRIMCVYTIRCTAAMKRPVPAATFYGLRAA